VFFVFTVRSQSVVSVYKIADLIKRIDTSKTTLVVNFWATWCAPCVKELPAFDSLSDLHHNYKVLLVSLDFKEDLKTKVDPFLKKNKILSECVLLDEVNGNDYINKIAESWSGAIPGTLFKNDRDRFFVQKKLHLSEIKAHLAQLEKK
jgi:thiol-disulfide isomerase/thioredoxin